MRPFFQKHRRRHFSSTSATGVLRGLLVTLIVVGSLAACGQRGDLTLPQTDKPDEAEQQGNNP